MSAHYNQGRKSSARNTEILQSNADDLHTRGAEAVHILNCELADPNLDHQAIVESLHQTLIGIDFILIAYGALGDQGKAQVDLKYARDLLQINYVSTISWILALRHYFLTAQRPGAIGVITSVAGDRGRASNYLYGSTKGGLNIFLSGLHDELAPMGISVITLKPGFVDSPMTSHLTKGVLWSQPTVVGQGIVQAFKNKSREVYLPWYWRYILLIIVHIPHCIFKKLKI